jgi:hypothetical protein
MARNIEKLLKIEHPKEVSKLSLDTIETIPTSLTLDLVDIEPYAEPRVTVNINLGLDQLEEQEE